MKWIFRKIIKWSGKLSHISKKERLSHSNFLLGILVVSMLRKRATDFPTVKTGSTVWTVTVRCRPTECITCPTSEVTAETEVSMVAWTTPSCTAASLTRWRARTGAASLSCPHRLAFSARTEPEWARAGSIPRAHYKKDLNANSNDNKQAHNSDNSNYAHTSPHSSATQNIRGCEAGRGPNCEDV